MRKFDFVTLIAGQKRKKFNDFTVFGKDTTYDTFSFQYEKYHFDQLKELMYHNVSTHIEVKDKEFIA